MAIGAAGKIFSNGADNIASTVADAMRSHGAKQGGFSKTMMGDSAHFADDMAHGAGQVADKQYWGAAKTFGKMSFDNKIGADMAGQGWKRTGAVAARNALPAAGFIAAANVPRYLSGGSATTNNQGQRDIAGIPFV